MASGGQQSSQILYIILYICIDTLEGITYNFVSSKTIYSETLCIALDYKLQSPKVAEPLTSNIYGTSLHHFISSIPNVMSRMIHGQNENNLKDWLLMGTVPLSTTILWKFMGYFGCSNYKWSNAGSTGKTIHRTNIHI